MPSLNVLIRRLGDLIGWRETYLNSGGDPRDTFEFASAQARRLRYAVYWAHYENNVYRKVHRWSAGLKLAEGLHDYIRSIYSPAYRNGEFWAGHLMGGTLDPNAGNGVDRPSALPILTENEAVRPAIARLWRLSNWQVEVQKWTRFGAVLGDVGLRIVDDEARRAVYLEVVHPGDVEEVTLDPFGNVKGYTIVELRQDPRDGDEDSGGPVLYREECVKDGEMVTFRTYLDDDLYDWRDYPDEDSPRIGPEWSMDYGFVPFVWTLHRDMGRGSGWAEMHPVLSKINEAENLVSKLDDQICKMVDGPWFISGSEASDITSTEPSPTEADPQPTRRWWSFLFSRDPAARATPMVAPLDIAATSTHIRTIIDSIEKDFPELLADDPGPNASGEARRVARQKAEAKVNERRPVYDDGLVRAHKMAVSIGTIRQYEGFEGFTRDSFRLGQLDHSIGERPVFGLDPLERLKEDQAQANVFKTWVDSGLPRALALKLVGWTEEQIATFEAAQRAEIDGQMTTIQRQRQLFGTDITQADMVPVNGQ